MPVPLKVKVVPGASRSVIAGWYGEALKIRVSAPPEKGKANRAVIELLAMTLDIPTSAITLVSGQTSPQKTLEIEGLDQLTLAAKLPVRP